MYPQHLKQYLKHSTHLLNVCKQISEVSVVEVNVTYFKPTLNLNRQISMVLQETELKELCTHLPVATIA